MISNIICFGVLLVFLGLIMLVEELMRRVC